MDHWEAIARGRVAAPTDAELAAHAAVGGLWRCVRIGQPAGLPFASHDMISGDIARGIRNNDAELGIVRRWWAITREGDLGAWPVVP